MPRLPRAHAAGAAALLCLVAAFAAAAPDGGEGATPPAARVVSLNPSLSLILVGLGAGDRLVGIDAASGRLAPELAGVRSVGGLFDPSLETVVALEPDIVVLVPSVEQQRFRDRLDELGVPTRAFRNIRFEEVLANIRDLGALVGRRAAADAVVDRIVRTRSAVEQAVAEREAVSCVVVLQRDPVFLVGGGTFLDEMLASAGCRNRARTLGEGYPRASLEWLIDAAPDAILDMSLDAAGGAGARDYWSRWPTLPAVERDRVLHVDAQLVTMPGPELDRALRTLARALHGEALDAAIATRLAEPRP